MKRRAFFLVALAAACSRKPRCFGCGMVLDPNGAWNVSLVKKDGAKVEFDTPKCAFGAWRDGRVDATDLLAHGYYDHQLRSARDLVFGLGSDVFGPMGEDLVPIEREQSARFGHDHPCRRLEAAAVTIDVVREVR